MILLHAKPRTFFLMHQCTHVDSKLVAHSVANSMPQKKAWWRRSCATATLPSGDTQARHEMAVGTLAWAERATWTGAGGSVCKTPVPCALTILFIAAGLLVCLVGDKILWVCHVPRSLCGI